MRCRLKSEKFPALDKWRGAFKNSVHFSQICGILDVMYNTLSINANTCGFECVRYGFFECTIILQKQMHFDWVLDITITKK